MTAHELARRAVACRHWRWMPGMRVRYGDGKAWYRLTDGDGYGMPFKHVPPNPRDALPDLSDDLTRLGLIALVEKGHGAPVAIWYPKDEGRCCVGWGRLPVAVGQYVTAPTLAEALVAALEAAP